MIEQYKPSKSYYPVAHWVQLKYFLGVINQLSKFLGTRFSTNGDTFGVINPTREIVDASLGPMITSIARFKSNDIIIMVCHSLLKIWEFPECLEKDCCLCFIIWVYTNDNFVPSQN